MIRMVFAVLALSITATAGAQIEMLRAEIRELERSR